MQKKEVKFFNTGKWAEHKPYLPQFYVQAGEHKRVPEDISMEIAEIAVAAGRAEWVVNLKDEAEAAADAAARAKAAAALAEADAKSKEDAAAQAVEAEAAALAELEKLTAPEPKGKSGKK